jgi:drug/metabolite transporter (DMT)-like permease
MTAVSPSSPHVPPAGRGAAPRLAVHAKCVVRGSTFLALRVAVQTIPPWSMIAVRCFVAGAVLAGFAIARGAAWPSRAGLASAALSGTLMFTFSQALLAWAEQRLASGPAAVLSCTVSLLMPAIAWVIGAAPRPGPVATFGLGLGFSGVVLLAHPGPDEGGLLPRAMALLAALAWALGAALSRRVKPADSVALGSGLQLLAGGIVCAVVAVIGGEPAGIHLAAISAPSILALLYLITMGSLLAFASFSWLVQIWPPDRLGTYAFINPVVALFLGAALAGETLGLREILASALILCAVAITLAGTRGGARWSWPPYPARWRKSVPPSRQPPMPVCALEPEA